jgi:hypothetical protein
MAAVPRRACVLALVASVVLPLAVTACRAPTTAIPASVERVLVVTLPGVTWAEVAGAELPTLERFVDESAIGAVSTRMGRAPATTTAAYLTMGAGTRSVVPGVDTGVALNPDEALGGVPATDLLRRRLGRTVSGIAYIPVGAAIDANANSVFAASPGLLGDTLRDAGVHRTVIANADAAEGFPTDEPPPDGAYARSAATALMGRDGVVPGGSVGRSLLQENRLAPFGREFDRAAVLEVFDDEWDGHRRVVALVEASDLARASAYRPRSTPTQARELRRRALHEADQLLAELLARTDLERDAVIVLAPTAPGSLGVVAMRAPGVDAGLLRSASTRRDGYVYLADLAPTVLSLLGEEPPLDIEGRPFDASSTEVDRIAHLRRQTLQAEVRADRLPVVVPILSIAVATLALVAMGRRRAGRQLGSGLTTASNAILGVIGGTFLAGAGPLAGLGTIGYLAVLGASGAAIASIAHLLDRRRPGLGLLVGTTYLVVVVGGDVLAGAHLQVNTVFGYSMAVAGRYTGIGNLAFALFATSALCTAVAVTERHGKGAAVGVGLGLLGVVLLEGLPMLGADVGGTLAVVPAFVLSLAVLRGARLRWWHAGMALALGLVVVGLFGLLDSARPAEAETHLARLGRNLADGRVDIVASTLWRRLNASFGSGSTIVWALGLSLVGVALAQAIGAARGVAGPGARLRDRPLGDQALAIGLAVLAVVGLVANDSSVAVPATMLLVVVPFLVLRTAARELVTSPSETT